MNLTEIFRPARPPGPLTAIERPAEREIRAPEATAAPHARLAPELLRQVAEELAALPAAEIRAAEAQAERQRAAAAVDEIQTAIEGAAGAIGPMLGRTSRGREMLDEMFDTDAYAKRDSLVAVMTAAGAREFEATKRRDGVHYAIQRAIVVQQTHEAIIQIERGLDAYCEALGMAEAASGDKRFPNLAASPGGQPTQFALATLANVTDPRVQDMWRDPDALRGVGIRTFHPSADRVAAAKSRGQELLARLTELAIAQARDGALDG